MRKYVLGMVTSLLSVGVLFVGAGDTPTPLSDLAMASVVGGAPGDTESDADCELNQEDCPFEAAPVGGTNSPCATLGAACDVTQTWCQDFPAGEECMPDPGEWLGFDCVVDPNEVCEGYVGKCVDMEGSQVCAGRMISPGLACGSVTKCHF